MMNPYKLAKFYDCNGDLTKRWYIRFWAYDETQKKIKEKTVWIPTILKTAKERRTWATSQIFEINTLLTQGYVFSATQKKNDFEEIKLIDALQIGLDIKKGAANSLVTSKDEDLGKNKGKNTIKTYSTAYNNFIDFLHHENLTDISLHDFCFHNDKGTKRNILRYRDYLLKSKDVSARTVNNRIVLIGSLFSELVQREIAKFNPASSIMKLKVKDGRNFAFSPDEKRKLINYIQEHDKELYVFVNFLYYTYIRPDELRFLRVKDLRTNQLYIDSGISKNNNSEFAMIPEHLEELIEKYEIRKRHGDSFLFFSVKNGLQVPRSENYFYQKHRAVLNLLEIDKRCTMYSWKHTGVCDAHDANIPIDYLRQQLRHKSLTTTQKYLKSLGKNLNMTIIKRFPKL